MRTLRTGRPGFTIVEMVVTVAIVAVLAGMIAPRLSGLLGRSQLREGASRLLVTAQYARDYAATRRVPCRLALDAEQGRYALTCPGEDGQADKFGPVPTSMGRSAALGRGLRFAAVTISTPPGEPEGPPDCVTFFPDGPAAAAVVQVSDGRRTFSLLVPPSGRVRLVEGAVAELPNDRIDLDE